MMVIIFSSLSLFSPGEAAVKDTSLLRMEGSDDVNEMIKQTEGKADEAKDDERIEKDAKRRATLEAGSSPRKKQGTPGKGGEMVVPDRDWTSDELFHLEKAMKRYVMCFDDYPFDVGIVMD